MKMPTLPTLEKNPKQPSEPKASKKEAKIVKLEESEDSIGLRIVACGIAILCIVTACLYVNSPPMLVFLYIWGALTGSYVSYQFRREKTFWLTFITSAGLLIVLGNFCDEMFTQFNSGKVSALIPFIHVLTGLQALHTFDLRAKSDINVSALIGLGLFACTAVLARDMLFAYITLGYITLAASLLYYEAVSRTQAAGAIGTSSERAEITAFRETAVKKRVSVGNAFMSLALLPVISIFVFFALPRVDSLFDVIVNNVRRAQNGETLNLNWVKSPNGMGFLATMTDLSTLPKSLGGKDSGGGTNPGGAGSGGAGQGSSGSGPDGKTDSPDSNGVGPGGKQPTNSGDGGSDRVSTPGSGVWKQGGKGKGNGPKSGSDAKNSKLSSKLGKGEKPPAPGAPKDERTPEQEDQSLVFRNKESAEHEDELIMRVSSSRETYYRRNCFDKYDGHLWTISGLGKVAKCAKRKAAYQELGGVPSLFVEPGMHSSQLTQEYTIEASIGHLIPVAAIPQQLSYPKDPILVDRFGCLKTPDPIKPGTTYRVVSQVPEYDLDEMRKAPFDTKTVSSEFESYLQLPANLSPEIKKLATSVAGTEGNSFVKADKICNFLRRNYKYSTDLSDANSKEEIAYHFLFRTKQGACGPFSTAFVVMCRAIGLPARCIGGFGPGDFNPVTGVHEIKNKHGHAWGEVYIPGYDWVPFDATPTGLLPKPTPEDNSFIGSVQKTVQQFQDHFSNQTPAPPPLPPNSEQAAKPVQQANGDATKSGANTGTGVGISTGTAKGGKSTGKGATDKPGASNSENASKTDQKAEKPKPADKPFDWSDWHETILLIIIVPAIMLLFQALRVAVQQARQAKKTKIVEKPKPSTLLYLKVVDDLARVKIHRLPTDTPEDLMSRFSEQQFEGSGVYFHPDLKPLCNQFMELYIADRFGCDDATELRATQLKKIGEEIHSLVRARHHDN